MKIVAYVFQIYRETKVINLFSNRDRCINVTE